eukprot:m.993187 g.993187  ORF g.993187 m.993187 type:complete len:1261 (-) comp24010_c0_seq2:479-4261(-)
MKDILHMVPNKQIAIESYSSMSMLSTTRRRSTRATSADRADKDSSHLSKRRRLSNTDCPDERNSDSECQTQLQQSSSSASPQSSPMKHTKQSTNGKASSSSCRRVVNFPGRKNTSTQARDYLELNSGYKMRIMTPEDIRTENDVEEVESPQPDARHLNRSAECSDHGGGKGKRQPKRGRRTTRWGKNPKKDTPKNRRKSGSATNSNELSGDTQATIPVAKFVSAQQVGRREFPPPPNHYVDATERVFKQSLCNHVEYDVDDEDVEWLALVNARRRKGGQRLIDVDVLESAMDLLERESFESIVALGQQQEEPYDDEAVCSICLLGDCENSNAILFCDGCNVPVHQECYGVRFIPDKAWFCRKCDLGHGEKTCSMCPMPGGALKQSDDGMSYAHVQCVLWIPELTFGNAQVRDPIFGLNNVDSKRTKELTCYICRQKKRGACIQCYDKRCFQAFHVTCAQEAGLALHLGDVLDGKDSTVCAYCHQHIPSWYVKEVCADPPLVSTTSSGVLKKDVAAMKKRRMQLMGTSTTNTVTGSANIPLVKPDILHDILKKHNFSEAELDVAKRIRQYWLLKRRSRSGVPLLRSLKGNTNNFMSLRAEAIQKERKKFHYIRRMLEKTRMLVGQVHRRERLKQDVLQNMADVFFMKAMPLRYILNHALDSICRRDVEEVFSDPVDVSQYPSYSSFVTIPVHTSLMRQRLHSGHYDTFAKFVKDFQLMCENCMKFNGDPNSWYHQYALDMLHAGNAILEATGELLGAVPMDPVSGALLKVDHDPVSPIGHALDVVYDIPCEVFDVLRVQCSPEKVSEITVIAVDAAETTSNADTRRADLNSVDQDADTIQVPSAPSAAPSAASSVASSAAPSAAPSADARGDEHDIDFLTEPGVGMACAAVVSCLGEESLENVGPQPTLLCINGHNTSRSPTPRTGEATSTALEDTVVAHTETQHIEQDGLEQTRTPTPPATDDSMANTCSLVLAQVSAPHIGPDLSTRERNISPHALLNETCSTDSTRDTKALTNGACDSGDSTKLPDTVSVRAATPICRAQEEDFDRVVFGLAKDMLDARRLEIAGKRSSKFRRIGHLLRCYRNEHYDDLPEKYQKLAGIDVERKMQLKREETAALAAKEKADNVVLIAGQVCWAKAVGYPWYPSLLVDPRDSTGSLLPNQSVFANGPVDDEWAPLDGTRFEVIESHHKFLLKFFDKKGSWAWLEKSKIKLMFEDDKLDKKLLSVRKSSQKADLKNAYQQAEVAHRKNRSKLKARKGYT